MRSYELQPLVVFKNSSA